jgi:multidrug resistance efflux pump
LVEPNKLVQKGAPLYRFDNTIYRLKLNEAEAKLAAAEQNVRVLQQQVIAARETKNRADAKLAFSKEEQARYKGLVPQGGAAKDLLDKWNEQVVADSAALYRAEANLKGAQLALDSTIGGLNTSVAQAKAQVEQAQYFLENCTIYAPQDGMIVSQQARPGLVVGVFRVGAIASFVTNEKPYLLATFRQQNLKFVKPGQEAEVALDLYPGEILRGKVKSVWWANAQGQYMPEGRLPEFAQQKPPGLIAVQIDLDSPNSHFIPTGGHAAVAIYTGGGKSFEIIRRINIRLYSFANFIRPFDI